MLCALLGQIVIRVRLRVFVLVLAPVCMCAKKIIVKSILCQNEKPIQIEQTE